MSFRYDASEEERAAAALLRGKGWNVAEPKCPLCQGWGIVGKSSVWGNVTTLDGTLPFGGGTYSSERCPNGCPPPTAYYSVNSPQRTVVADGTVGMRRGE